MRTSLCLAVALTSLTASAQERPAEADLFGADEPAVDAGVPGTTEAAAAPADAGTVEGRRDSSQLSSGPITSRFDTDEEKSDPLKIGGTLNFFGQAAWKEGPPFESGAFSAPLILDAYLDGRPNDRVRAFVLGRLQFDPTRLGTTSGSTPAPSIVGLTQTTSTNPSVLLDQLWLRFDIARTVYVTVGRQKVRWGVSRIWYPTDFLNSQPRDALNPFDARLGVNMVKLHVPVESLGWNFYAYGLLDAIDITSSGVKLSQLGGALRAEFVLGPAEVGLGGVWQQGRRPRYGVDVSAALGPFDVYAEAAFRDARDFVMFRYPTDLQGGDLLSKVGQIEAYRPEGVMVQVSGGASWQFNYTDKNFAILTAEYFYNPAGYTDPVGFQVQTFVPGILGVKLDPIQNTALYSGRHNVAITLAAPGIPGADWITVALSNIVILNDPSALTRLDVIFRVLSYLNIQVFASALYGQAGGQLRFSLPGQLIEGLVTFSPEADREELRTSLETLRDPPVVQAGVLLRLSI
jgi:hypothetical protein